MEHNAPHAGAAFEGYYQKFLFPSGANLVIVICKVAKAKTRPYKLSVTYVPRDASKIWQREFFPEGMEMKKTGNQHDFILDVPEIGTVKWVGDDVTEYDLSNDAFTFRATASKRIPWSNSTDTPEGVLVNLPLPLHWHVHSFASSANCELQLKDYDLPSSDTSAESTVHQEKNWAFSFPSAHMWVCAREGGRGLCLAGGEILGMEAFLLGYRSSDLSLDFRPPFAVRFAGVSPFMSYTTTWEDRSFQLSIQSFRQKIEVKAKAPKGSFFSLSPPFPEGHRENYLGQSFQASVEVKIYESGWFSSWELVKEDIFENAGLEFGANYYPPAGSAKKFN